MKTLILAAGRGSRMQEITEDQPKCLIHLAGKSLLDRQLAALAHAQPDEMGIVTGWKAEAIEDAAPNLVKFHNRAWQLSTMVSSLQQAESWLASDVVIVSYGDIVFGPGPVAQLVASSAPLAIAYDVHWRSLWERRFPDPLEDAETFTLTEGSDSVGSIGSRPRSLDEVQGQYMGLLRITPRGWQEIQSVICEVEDKDWRKNLDMTGLLAQILARGRMSITAVATSDPWCEIDRKQDLAIAMEVLSLLDPILFDC